MLIYILGLEKSGKILTVTKYLHHSRKLKEGRTHVGSMEIMHTSEIHPPVTMIAVYTSTRKVQKCFLKGNLLINGPVKLNQYQQTFLDHKKE